jgi:hypothetical protein
MKQILQTCVITKLIISRGSISKSITMHTTKPWERNEN